MLVNGRKAMPTSGSRTEFLSVDALGSTNDIQYGRSGGWFVSTKKAMFLVALAIAGMVIVGILVHYLSTCKSTKEEGTSTDASVVTPKIGPSATPEPNVEDFLLSKDVTPSHYILKLEPYLEEPDPAGNNFTYKGHVSIIIKCHKATNKVTFHSKNLTLDNITISHYNVTITATSPISTTGPTASVTVPTTPATNQTAPVRQKRNTHSSRRRAAHHHSTTPAPTTFAPGTPPQIKDRVESKEKDTITLNLRPGLEEGQTYILDIPFTGNLTDSLYGFYRSRYNGANGTTVWMATTQFEAPHAREAFPCFDEPDMKATFEISISRGANMSTASNMPIRLSEPVKDQPGRVWDHYEVSPVMSTYLLAFIVSHSDFIPTNDTTPKRNEKGPEFRVFARKQLIESASYAASIGPRVLQFYEDYFGIPYPLPKVDMAAIPDFAAGAMENWGLVTYREVDLLYDPKSTSTKQKDRLALVVAHELAHQWFGNLVTMKWWNDLWLNEGFATYMEYVGADHVEPTWAMLDKFYVYDQQIAMALDSLNSTHPVSTKVANPGQISELFDRISYSKGASLIRMLNNTITEDVLRKGLSRYLNKWKYSNAEEKDLWEALTAQVRESDGSLLPDNVTVGQFMDTWTLQDGYPVLTVTRDYENGSATLTQARFTLDNSSSDTLWYIPVSYVTQDEMNDTANLSSRTSPRLWLKREQTTTISNLTKPKSSNWVLFNVHATGYYRVNYDDRNWKLLASELLTSPPQSMLPAITRAQLLDDALYLARAGTLRYDVALNLTRYLAVRENHYVPWSSFLNKMTFIETMLRETKNYGMFQEYILKTLMSMKKNLGFSPASNETQLLTLLRPLIMQWLSNMGDPGTVAWAMDLFKQWRNSTNPDTDNPIPVDFRSVVYCTGVKMGGKDEFDFVMKRYQSAAEKPSESSVLLSSLGCTREEWLIVSLLDMSLESGGDIRLQDAYRVWYNVPNTATSSRIGFNYLRNNWDTIYNKYGKDEFLLGALLEGSISGLSSKLDMMDVYDFYNNNQGKFSYVERKMNQDMEALKLRVAWHQNHYETISTWLHKYQQSQ